MKIYRIIFALLVLSSIACGSLASINAPTESPSESTVEDTTTDPVDSAVDNGTIAGSDGQLHNPYNYPIISGATDLSSLENGVVFFRYMGERETVFDFYRDELTAQGWTLTDEVSFGPLAELHFEKEGERGVLLMATQLDDETVSGNVGPADE